MREWHEKFRWFFTSSGKLVIGGKSAGQNEELMDLFIGKPNMIVHTAEAGSPFCIIAGKPEKTDLKEAAIFCARHSRDWKKNKRDVEVHAFTGKDVYKDKGMKTGTFGVKRIKRKIKVRKEKIENSM